MRPRGNPVPLQLDDQLSWDIFNSYAENREDDEDPSLSSHWTMSALSGPPTGYSDSYYGTAPLRSRFSPTHDESPSLMLKTQRRDGDDGIRALFSAAHDRASKKSKRAFGKILSHLTKEDEGKENDERSGLRTGAADGRGMGPGLGTAGGPYRYPPASGRPERPRHRRAKSEKEGPPTVAVLQISSPRLISAPSHRRAKSERPNLTFLHISSAMPEAGPPSPPPLGRATTFVRRTKALPLRPSPIPAI
ncbi:hypothetical protein C8J56DRAFT_910991 [Mycena floridula]|nr:hypothetical protein C8J56DRAFT_910991 [Mycena floridula]